MAQSNMKTPFLTIGPVDKLRALLNTPGSKFYDLDRPIYNYIDSGENIGQMVFVNPDDKSINYIVGHNNATEGYSKDEADAKFATHQEVEEVIDFIIDL